MSEAEPGSVYEALSRLLLIDEEKNRLIGMLAAAICQQYGADALPDGSAEMIERAVKASGEIRRVYG